MTMRRNVHPVPPLDQSGSCMLAGLDVPDRESGTALDHLLSDVRSAKTGFAEDFEFSEGVVPADDILGRTPVSQSLDTIDFEIFKITEMARRWITENGLSPYKLALVTGTSPSQVHRVMEPGWTPSLKLARKIASSLPPEWVTDFEQDCNACLPRMFSLRSSPFTNSEPINRLMRAIRSGPAEKILSCISEDSFCFRHFRLLSRTELMLLTASNIHREPASLEYAPPPPRMVYSPTGNADTDRTTRLWLHRNPIRSGDRINLYTIHIAEVHEQGRCFQFWKIENCDDLSKPRQLQILDNYLADCA